MPDADPLKDFGLTCPSGSSFYVCPDARVRFLGCCTHDPCADKSGECGNDDLRPVAFMRENYEDIPPQQCMGDATVKWYTCASNKTPFMGCCAENPCGNGSAGCKTDKLYSARLNDDAGKAQAFLGRAADTATTTTSSASTTASTPKETITSDDGDAGSNEPPPSDSSSSTTIQAAIIAVSGAVALFLIAGLIFWYLRRKRRRTRSEAISLPAPWHNTGYGPGGNLDPEFNSVRRYDQGEKAAQDGPAKLQAEEDDVRGLMENRGHGGGLITRGSGSLASSHSQLSQRSLSSHRHHRTGTASYHQSHDLAGTLYPSNRELVGNAANPSLTIPTTVSVSPSSVRASDSSSTYWGEFDQMMQKRMQSQSKMQQQQQKPHSLSYSQSIIEGTYPEVITYDPAIANTEPPSPAKIPLAPSPTPPPQAWRRSTRDNVAHKYQSEYSSRRVTGDYGIEPQAYAEPQFPSTTSAGFTATEEMGQRTDRMSSARVPSALVPGGGRIGSAYIDP